jgi:hypothetical protein
MAESGIEQIEAIHWTGLSAAASRAYPLESVENADGLIRVRHQMRQQVRGTHGPVALAPRGEAAFSNKRVARRLDAD